MQPQRAAFLEQVAEWRAENGHDSWDVMGVAELRKCLAMAALLFAFLLSACGPLAKTQEFDPVVGITRITIRLPGEELQFRPVVRQERIIDDPAEVHFIVSFINEERSGWGGDSDQYGVPVPDLRVSLYEGDTFRGHFGVGVDACRNGNGFFETNLVFPFAAKAASRERCEAFLALLGL